MPAGFPADLTRLSPWRLVDLLEAAVAIQARTTPNTSEWRAASRAIHALDIETRRRCVA